VIQNPLDILVQVFLTPFIVGTLGKSAYGIWTLTGSTLSYIAELRAGLNSAVSYHVPRLHQKQDLAGINRVVSTVSAFYAAVTILGAILVALLAWRFPVWFNVPEELRTVSRIVAVIAGVGLEATIATSAYSGVLAGLQRYDVMVGSRVGFVVVRALGIFVVLTMGAGLVGLAGVSVAIEIGLAAWIVIAAYRLLPGLRVQKGLVSLSILPGLMAYSTSSLMFGSGQLILSQAGKILVGILYTPEAVTDFSIPFVLLTMVGGFVLAMTRAVKPMATLLEAMDEPGKLRSLYLLSTKYTMMIAIPGAATFVLFGGDLLRAWMGQDYGGPGGLLLAVMAVPQMLRVTQLAGYYVITGLGKHRYFGLSILIQAVSGIVLAFVLARVAGLGLLGVAIGVSIPEIVGCGYFIPRYCLRTLGLRARDQLAQAFRPAAVACAPVLLYLVAVHQTVSIDSRLALAGVFGVAGVIWAVALWLFGLSGDERARFRALARRPGGAGGTS
jgi:O-antigen/teichoic acid export membrane protein